MKVFVCGSLNYDLVTFTDRVPNAGETFKAGKFETHAGGKGLNQCVAISRLLDPELNADVTMIGHVGDDSFGSTLLDILKQNNIRTDLVKTLSGVSTGVATILIEQKSGQNRILISEGANGFTKYQESQLEQLFPTVKPGEASNYVVFQNEIPGTIPIMNWIKKNREGYVITYNPSPFCEIPKESWGLADLLIVNEIEALQVLDASLGSEETSVFKKHTENDMIEGYKLVAKSLQKLLNDGGHGSSVVITLGAEGSLFIAKDSTEPELVEALKVKKVVDTTGAGDTFLGGVVSQLCRGSTLQDAVVFATKASSLSIQRSGAAESIPSFSELNN